MNEFELIRRFFQAQNIQRNDVAISIGDDCAILTPPAKQQLAVSMDTLVSGVHFYPDMPAFDLGYKALAVNLSDLAAAGAEPAWFTLALTLPQVHEQWLEEFSRGLFSLANIHQMQLIGGDTTQGPLAITIQVHGFTPQQQAHSRAGAQIGDEIYVTGSLGDAAYGLSLLQQPREQANKDYFLSRLYRPTPRIDIGLALREIASAAIDISDGLAGDLSHILERSKVGATIFLDKLPLSSQLRAVHDQKIWEYALTGGEDYELCFTVASAKKSQLEKVTEKLACPITKIGEIQKGKELVILNSHLQPITLSKMGYDHFA